MSSPESGSSTRRGDAEFSDAEGEPASFAIIREAYEQQGQNQRVVIQRDGQQPTTPGRTDDWVKEQAEYAQQHQADSVNRGPADRDTMDVVVDLEQVALQTQNLSAQSSAVASRGAAAQTKRSRLADRRNWVAENEESSATADYLAARGDLGNPTQAFEPDMGEVGRGLTARFNSKEFQESRARARESPQAAGPPQEAGLVPQGQQRDDGGETVDSYSSLQERIRVARARAEKHQKQRDAYRQQQGLDNDGQGR
jgi:hypothetical protein